MRGRSSSAVLVGLQLTQTAVVIFFVLLNSDKLTAEKNYEAIIFLHPRHSNKNSQQQFRSFWDKLRRKIEKS